MGRYQQWWRCPICKDRFKPVIRGFGQNYCSATCAKVAGATEELNRIRTELDRRLQEALKIQVRNRASLNQDNRL